MQIVWSVRANNTSRDVWLRPDHPGQPDLGPWSYKGRDVYRSIADGNTDQLPFTPRWRRSRGTRLGDLLWTTEKTKIASAAFVAVLDEVGATGWTRFDVDVLDRKDQPLGEYVGLAVTDADPAHDLHWSHGAQNWDMLLSDRAYRALEAAGANRFYAEPA